MLRIVSLVPSHTESLFALGVGSSVVGRTRFCIAPAAGEAIPHVGGTKDATLAKIMALKPDLVVADRDENPKALVEALEANGVHVLWSEIAGISDAASFLETLGAAVGAPDAGAAAALEIRGAVERLHQQVVDRGQKPRAFIPIWHPWMTFDATAYPNAMLLAAGIENVFAGHSGPRYFEVTDAEVRATDAAWTLLPTEPFPFHKKIVPTADLGPCGTPSRVRIIDGEALTWFGVRTGPALQDLGHLADTLVEAG